MQICILAFAFIFLKDSILYRLFCIWHLFTLCVKNFKNNHQRLEIQSVASTQMAKKWEGAESRKIFNTKMKKIKSGRQGGREII